MLHYYTIRGDEYVHLGSSRYGLRPMKAVFARLRGEPIYVMGW